MYSLKLIATSKNSAIRVRKLDVLKTMAAADSRAILPTSNQGDTISAWTMTAVVVQLRDAIAVSPGRASACEGPEQFCIP